MAERLTTRFHGILVKEADVSKIQVITKLGQLEDIMDKYGIESAEELDSLIANYKISSILTEDRIKEIAVNEQRKIMQSMIKEIVEKECNQLYTECDTWKRACELACDVLRDINYKIYNEDRIDFENTFYQQAKKEGNDE